MRIFNVTFDARDAAGLAGFWSEVVGRPVGEGANEHFARIEGADGAPHLLFIQVPEDRAGKNRVHIDLDAPRLDDARTRLEGLGATFVHEMDEYGLRWFTFRDPEGNEFCVGSHE
jgi:predicted enzyme related to lactoylglutathione lyase